MQLLGFKGRKRDPRPVGEARSRGQCQSKGGAPGFWGGRAVGANLRTAVIIRYMQGLTPSLGNTQVESTGPLPAPTESNSPESIYMNLPSPDTIQPRRQPRTTIRQGQVT